MTSDDSSSKILIENILSSNFTGLSGEISFKEGRLLQTPILRVINVLGKKDRELDFWLPGFGFSKSLEIENDTRGRNSRTGLICAVIWPGDLSKRDPKGWAMPTDSKRLKIVVPGRTSFDMFVKVNQHEKTLTYDGFCIRLFEEVRKVLGYALPYEFYPVNGTYDELINGVHNKTYDDVVGDVTILASRSKLVEFTQPYAESGLSMIVPAKSEESAWMFMRPFTRKMWVVTCAILIYTMLIVWLLEHIGYGLNIPMVPNQFTNAETSWRRDSVWKYEVMFEGGLRMKRTEEIVDSSNRCVFGSGMTLLLFSSAAQDNGRQRSVGYRCRYRCENGNGNGSGRRDLAREDHGFLSGLIQHGLGSGWPTTT